MKGDYVKIQMDNDDTWLGEVVAEEKGPRVVVFDEELAQQPGQFVSGEQVDKLAVVATSGLMAEASAYGKAVGASEDLALLNQILLRCNPPIPAQKQQDLVKLSRFMGKLTHQGTLRMFLAWIDFVDWRQGAQDLMTRMMTRLPLAQT